MWPYQLVEPQHPRWTLVGFATGAQLVAGDTNAVADGYRLDRQTGTLELATVTLSGVQGDASSAVEALSHDGRFLAFRSTTTNVVSGVTNGRPDLFARDMVAGTTERQNLRPNGGQTSWFYAFT